jgi:hypothetical protein
MLELPRNRIRLRRKARGDNLVPFSRDTSSRDASAGADGRRLTMRRTIFMVAVQAPRAGERLNQSRGSWDKLSGECYRGKILPA